jgi:hypothetical protein
MDVRDATGMWVHRGGAVGCDGELRGHSIRRKMARQAYGSDLVNLELREASAPPPVR